MRTPAITAPPSSLTDVFTRNADLVQAHAEELLKPMRERLKLILALVAWEFRLMPDDLNKSTEAILPARRAAVVLAAEFLNPPLDPDIVADWLGVSERTLYRFKSAVRLARKRDFDYETRLNRLHGLIREALAEVRPPKPPTEETHHG